MTYLRSPRPKKRSPGALVEAAEGPPQRRPKRPNGQSRRRRPPSDGVDRRSRSRNEVGDDGHVEVRTWIFFSLPIYRDISVAYAWAGRCQQFAAPFTLSHVMRRVIALLALSLAALGLPTAHADQPHAQVAVSDEEVAARRPERAGAGAGVQRRRRVRAGHGHPRHARRTPPARHVLRHGLVGRAAPRPAAPDRRRRPRDRQPRPLHLRSDASHATLRCVPISKRADSAISAVTGRTTRPLWSPSAGYRNARVRAIAAGLGYRPILWTVDSGDWTTEATPESVYSHVVAGAENGAIDRAPLRQSDHARQHRPGAARDHRRLAGPGLPPGDDHRPARPLTGSA